MKNEANVTMEKHFVSSNDFDENLSEVLKKVQVGITSMYYQAKKIFTLYRALRSGLSLRFSTPAPE